MSNIKTKKPAEIEAILDQGVQGDFWQVIVDALNESIEHIENSANDEEFKNLPAEQYKLENELVKAKIKYLKQLKNTPQNIKSWLTSPDSKTTNFDPYAQNTPDTDT